MNETEQIWDEFWKPIVTNEDGTLNLEQVKKELCDFKLVMDMVPTVYDNITGGRFTKLLTHPEYIISAAEEHFKVMHDIDDEERKEELERKIDRISKECEQEIEDWKAANRILKAQNEMYKEIYQYLDKAIYTQHCTMNHIENTEHEKGQISGLIQASNMINKSLKKMRNDI